MFPYVSSYVKRDLEYVTRDLEYVRDSFDLPLTCLPLLRRSGVRDVSSYAKKKICPKKAMKEAYAAYLLQHRQRLQRRALLQHNGQLWRHRASSILSSVLLTDTPTT
jgi:hypothetical protein